MNRSILAYYKFTITNIPAKIVFCRLTTLIIIIVIKLILVDWLFSEALLSGRRGGLPQKTFAAFLVKTLFLIKFPEKKLAHWKMNEPI